MGKKKNSLDRSDFISMTALLMSMVAVFVSIYEAQILKEQQLIMQTQEKTSVWPYLDGTLSYRYADNIQIRYDFENKGIGPTKVRKMVLEFNGTPIKDYMTLIDSIRQYFPEEADMGGSFQPVEGDVLSPGEKITALLIESKRFPGDLKNIRKIGLRFDVCYCSVYDECWSLDENEAHQRLNCE